VRETPPNALSEYQFAKERVMFVERGAQALAVPFSALKRARDIHVTSGEPLEVAWLPGVRSSYPELTIPEGTSSGRPWSGWFGPATRCRPTRRSGSLRQPVDRTSSSGTADGDAYSAACRRRRSRPAIGAASDRATISALTAAWRRRGFATVLYLRLAPVVPFNTFNYACRATGVRGRD
jgi:hypothetical protein